MKTTIYKSLCMAAMGAVTLGFTACNNDDFLDVDHSDIYEPDLMYKSEEYATRGLNGIYDCLFKDDQYADAWNYKPQLFFGCHPTLDTQCTGWDTKWCNQTWTGGDADLGKGYNYTYRAIGRANEFLAGLEKEENSYIKTLDCYKYLDGEARALRAYFYMFLAENWGRVPMLATGETFITTPNKAKADTDDEMWDFIIADLKEAANELTWTPYNGEYGRCTKGMALSYLGEAYMWKAYKARVNGEGDAKSDENIRLAKAALEEVINSGTYELAPSYTTLWDAGEAWPKEAVWQVVNDMGKGNYGAWNSDAQIFNNFFAASTNGGGGWGSQYMSWELYFLYELGDKRRDASMCTNPVPELQGTAYQSPYCYGYNPYMQQWLGYNSNDPASGLNGNDGYMFNNGEFAPGIWTMKLWRLQRANWATPHSPCHFYYKRYAGVLLDYAECLFRLNGGNDAQAWAIIDQIRNRAFGNEEVGKADDLTAKFLPYYNTLANANWAYGDYHAMTEYPIPFNTATVTVPDAQTYYTAMTNEGLQINITGTPETLCLPFSGKAEPWQVALGQERRKEFNSEWNLKADLQRSEFLPVHLECDYPKGVGLPGDNQAKKNNWHYYRDWDFNPQRLLMPFPTDETLKNTLLEQNPGY